MTPESQALLQALKTASEALVQVEIAFDRATDSDEKVHDAFATGYPFAQSFDELVVEFQEWRARVQEKLTTEKGEA